jgi:hypothetical protein
MAVSIDEAGQAGGTTELFRSGFPRFSEGQVYAVSHDGQRILGGLRPPPPTFGAVQVIVNWPARLRNRQTG